MYSFEQATAAAASRPSLLAPSPPRRPSLTFMSGTGTPAAVAAVSSSRRNSYIVDDAHSEGTAELGSDRTKPTSSEAARSATSSRFVDFAKMRNPTIALRLGPRFTVELTYAALLQYASMLVSAPRSAQLFVPRLSAGVAEQVAYSQPSTRSTRSVWLSMLSTLAFLVALATLDVRQKSEQLGLRRISLVLCTLLFLLSSMLATWPVQAERGAIVQICTAMPGADTPDMCTPVSEQSRPRRHHPGHEFNNGAAIDRLCASIKPPSSSIVRLQTQANNVVFVQCRQH